MRKPPQKSNRCRILTLPRESEAETACRRRAGSPSLSPMLGSSDASRPVLHGLRSNFAISLCRTDTVCPSSHLIVTPLQVTPTMVPRSVTILSQQTRSSTLSCLDCSPVIRYVHTDCLSPSAHLQLRGPDFSQDHLQLSGA
jgi:hypothetical protein